MANQSPIVQKTNSRFPATVLRTQDEWGLITADVVNPPRRLLGKETSSLAQVEQGLDGKRLRALPTPTDLLGELPDGDNWAAQTRRSLARLRAYFLVCEDPQRRLEAREVSTLAHQVSLVRHILDSDRLKSVLIADEVGLGKTVEVGLLLKELLAKRPHLRVLYLSPARLVSNVRREFERLGLPFRQWSAVDADARLSDSHIIASIHRAVHPRHSSSVVDTPPWDVLIVDECHHLSDWAPGGGDPREKFRLVRELIARQTPDGRVVFLSGTPHQGHVSRFENLLGLLRRSDETEDTALQGRVIYRTKDDVRDWTGALLFPRRRVNEPHLVDLGAGYRKWITNIHSFFKPSGNDVSGQSAGRAAGWRCAQALQWAASSPQAGLGYLTRQAMRAGWTFSDRTLADCVAALRPYRGGPPDEPPGQLFDRIQKEISRQKADADVDDIEDDVAAADGDDAALRELLIEGLAIVRDAADEKWDYVYGEILQPAGDEKVVLFAQPIETVTALANYLERVTSERPAVILGGQSDTEREAEVRSFQQPDGPRYLVSSRAGGEGINLQVARRLVHIDVPWNPMDMEQRVGRVHRFGSRKEIIVDTVVVKDSREADAYRIAESKLRLIASTMVEPERFDSVFARVMCLVPPEDLQSVMINAPTGPFTPEDQEAIAAIVREGFRAWSEFDARFAEQQRQIQALDPGLARWDDLAGFLRDYGRAELSAEFVTQRFAWQDGEMASIEQTADVLRLADGQFYACGDHGGAPVFGPGHQTASQLGLNLDVVQTVLQQAAFPSQPSGAAHVRWSSDHEFFLSTADKLTGVLLFVQQSVKTDERGGWTESGLSLHGFCVTSEQPAAPVPLDKRAIRKLFDGLSAATVRTRPADAAELVARLHECQNQLRNQLRRPNDDELRQGVRHAVLPLLAAVIER